MQDAEGSKTDNGTVEDCYNIDADELYLKVNHGDFWMASYKFFESVKFDLFEKMTEKQKKWLHKIELALNKDNNI